MTTFNEIYNVTNETIETTLANLVSECENSEAMQNGDFISADIFIRFNDGTFLSLIPTWWNMGEFSGYHASDTKEHDWLDDDDDMGEISDNANWLKETAGFVVGYMRKHDGINYMMTTIETDEEE